MRYQIINQIKPLFYVFQTINNAVILSAKIRYFTRAVFKGPARLFCLICFAPCLSHGTKLSRLFFCKENKCKLNKYKKH